MICSECGYMMDAFDKECPRCHGHGISTKPTQQPPTKVSAGQGHSPSQNTPPIQATAPTTNTKCPFCAEDIKPNAIKCGHCGEWLNASAQPAPIPSNIIPHPSVSQKNAFLQGQSYISQSNVHDEITIYCAKLHWVIFVWPCIVSLCLIVIGIAISSFFAVIGLVIPAIVVVRYLSAEFAVTNKRLLSKDGFIKIRSNELMLRQVEGLTVEQSVLGRMLNYGTLIVSGTGGSKESFRGIAEPLEFRKQIQMRIAP